MKSVYADSIAKMMRKYGFHSPDMEINEFVAECLPANNDVLSGWIPCSERMPEPGVNVLVTDGINQMVTWHEVIDGKAMWVDNFIVYVNVRFGEVTHWMPLPESPGGDDNA